MPDIPIRSNAVVVYVLRRTARGPEVLLLKRSKKDGDGLDQLWLHVAGKIEKDEKAWQAAIRELSEETGLTPRKFYSTNFCEQFYSVKQDVICILPVFLAEIKEDDKVVINHEHSEFKWFTMEEAYKAVSMNNQRECLDMVKRSFVDNAPHPFSVIDMEAA